MGVFVSKEPSPRPPSKLSLRQRGSRMLSDANCVSPSMLFERCNRLAYDMALVHSGKDDNLPPPPRDRRFQSQGHLPSERSTRRFSGDHRRDGVVRRSAVSLAPDTRKPRSFKRTVRNSVVHTNRMSKDGTSGRNTDHWFSGDGGDIDIVLYPAALEVDGTGYYNEAQPSLVSRDAFVHPLRSGSDSRRLRIGIVGTADKKRLSVETGRSGLPNNRDVDSGYTTSPNSEDVIGALPPIDPPNGQHRRHHHHHHHRHHRHHHSHRREHSGERSNESSRERHEQKRCQKDQESQTSRAPSAVSKVSTDVSDKGRNTRMTELVEEEVVVKDSAPIKDPRKDSVKSQRKDSVAAPSSSDESSSSPDNSKTEGTSDSSTTETSRTNSSTKDTTTKRQATAVEKTSCKKPKVKTKSTSRDRNNNMSEKRKKSSARLSLTTVAASLLPKIRPSSDISSYSGSDDGLSTKDLQRLLEQLDSANSSNNKKSERETAKILKPKLVSDLLSLLWKVWPQTTLANDDPAESAEDAAAQSDGRSNPVNQLNMIHVARLLRKCLDHSPENRRIFVRQQGIRQALEYIKILTLSTTETDKEVEPLPREQRQLRGKNTTSFVGRGRLGPRGTQMPNINQTKPKNPTREPKAIATRHHNNFVIGSLLGMILACLSDSPYGKYAPFYEEALQQFKKAGGSVLVEELSDSLEESPNGVGKKSVSSKAQRYPLLIRVRALLCQGFAGACDGSTDTSFDSVDYNEIGKKKVSVMKQGTLPHLIKECQRQLSQSDSTTAITELFSILKLISIRNAASAAFVAKGGGLVLISKLIAPPQTKKSLKPNHPPATVAADSLPSVYQASVETDPTLVFHALELLKLFFQQETKGLARGSKRDDDGYDSVDETFVTRTKNLRQGLLFQQQRNHKNIAKISTEILDTNFSSNTLEE